MVEMDVVDPPPWGKSAARDVLYEMVKDGLIPGDLKPKRVYLLFLKHLPEFAPYQDYTALKFANKMRSARLRAPLKANRAAEDAEFLAHDRAIFPKPTEDWMGEPIWKGSDAHTALVKDIEDGLHLLMEPKELYEHRAVYYENFWNQDRFRNRIYQEEKALKRTQYLARKAEKKAAKEADAIETAQEENQL